MKLIKIWIEIFQHTTLLFNQVAGMQAGLDLPGKAVNYKTVCFPEIIISIEIERIKILLVIVYRYVGDQGWLVSCFQCRQYEADEECAQPSFHRGIGYKILLAGIKVVTKH